MLDINDYKDTPMFGAIIELNERLKEEGFGKIELNTIGGFAMMTHGYRAMDGMTDIDYVGPELSKKVCEIADEIGLKYGLGRKWINNDVLLSGTTLEDMEFSTGKLHFQEAFDLENIKINILDTKDLLRMKVIAIDTSLSGVELGDGDFSRYKDFSDVVRLKNALGMSNIDIKNEMGDYIYNSYTITAIKAFEMGGIERVDSLIGKMRKENSLWNGLGAPAGAENKSYTRSSFIDDVLNSAMLRSSKYNTEKDEPIKPPGNEAKTAS